MPDGVRKETEIFLRVPYMQVFDMNDEMKAKAA